ncbi:MAG: hypothetical protein HY916_08535 [Desulfovibrio sp.]|nr:hypothetical protein [Desulfovibrio sp.]
MGGEFSIEVEDCGGYCRMTMHGPYLVAGEGEYSRLAQLAEESGHLRFLMDVRGVAPRASIPEVFEYVVRHYPPRPDNSRTATVDLPENMISARFFEHLMQNKGRTYRLFMDEAEAVAWLLSDEP